MSTLAEMTSLRQTEKKTFLVCEINPSAFPICPSRQYNEPVAILGSLKSHQQSNGPPGTARGSLIWTPVPTQWVVSHSLFSFSFRRGWGGWYVQHGRWVMSTAPHANGACADAPRCFWKSPRDNVFCHTRVLLGEKANSFHKREVQAMLVNYQQKIWVLLSDCDTGKGKKKKVRDRPWQLVCKWWLQPSCHSRTVKWITLKVRESLAHLSNSSSPKPICLPVTVALGD